MAAVELPSEALSNAHRLEGLNVRRSMLMSGENIKEAATRSVTGVQF